MFDCKNNVTIATTFKRIGPRFTYLWVSGFKYEIFLGKLLFLEIWTDFFEATQIFFIVAIV